MNLRTVVGLVVVGLTVVAATAGERFSLVTEKGEKLGPFELKDGATVKVDGQTLRVAREQTAAQALDERLKNTVIPGLNFSNAPAKAVLEFLREAGRSAGPEGKGITVVLNDSPAVRTNACALTLAATQILLKSALDLCLRPLGLRHVPRDDHVLILGQSDPAGPIVRKIYRVLPTIVERVPAMTDGEPETPDLKEFYASLGVPWPDGSSIKYLRACGLLAVANTAENLAIMDRVTVALNVMPSQIEIEIQFLAFDRADISELVRHGAVRSEDLRALREKGKAEMLAAPKVVTQSGQDATVKGVVEYIYPTELWVGPVGQNDTNSPAVTTGMAATPASFETREVGCIFQVHPEVTSAGLLIELSMTPELVAEPEWEEYEGEMATADGKTHPVRIRQPLFSTQTVQTRISIENGATVVFGGGTPTRDGKKVIYTLVTATLIGADGKPLASASESRAGAAEGRGAE